METIKEMQEASYKNAVVKGFWEGKDPVATIPEKIALIHSELSEALEIVRSGHAPIEVWYTEKGHPEGFGIDLADAIIRILDLAQALGIDEQSCINLKMAYNSTRPTKHGKMF